MRHVLLRITGFRNIESETHVLPPWSLWPVRSLHLIFVVDRQSLLFVILMHDNFLILVILCKQDSPDIWMNTACLQQ